MFKFKIIKEDKKTEARLGILQTPHGSIHTPAFVPVATKGALRGLSFEAAAKYGAEVFMINTFHLFHNDRYKIIRRFGGLHKLLNVNYPLMTDSGGFQVFSLGFGREQQVGKLIRLNNPHQSAVPSGRASSSQTGRALRPRQSALVKIDNDGVIFRSPYDGRQLRLTPELSIKIQQQLGADIIFAFDECTSPLHDYAYTKQSLQRTHQWAIRCVEMLRNQKSKVKSQNYNPKVKKQQEQAMFGIVQGGRFRDLRIESAKFIASLPFDGFGIGGSFGSSYGDSKKNMYEVLDRIVPYLPENKPRHLLGIGEVDDLVEAVERGIDLFDCVIPTRLARHGEALTFKGPLNLKSSKFLNDQKAIDPRCKCNICFASPKLSAKASQNYSRAYICHLLREQEIYGIMLLTEHNLAWILSLMKQIKQAIDKNYFAQFKQKVLGGH